MIPHKRGGSFNHYDNGRPKKHRQNDTRNPNLAPASHADRNRNEYGSGPNHDGLYDRKFKNKDNPVLEHIERLPDPAKCKPCKLAAAELRSGIIALLDKFAAEEQTHDGDRDVLHHAQELRRLLSARANRSLPSQAKQELDVKRPDKGTNVSVPAYIEQKMERTKHLPPLPPITEPSLREAVFTHISHYSQSDIRGFTSDKISYETLEFLGDAYIELIASRLIYNRFPHVDVPQQSTFRELLVKNETLGEFSAAYGLPDRLKHGGHIAKSKAWTKVIADVFEAYVAAVVLSDPEDGFQTAEKWLTELWAPQLLSYKEAVLDNPKARDDIQRLVSVRGVKLDYRDERDMEMVDGVQKYFVGLYMTGWGYHDEWLGSGEGRNKAQAGVAAATHALQRNSSVLQAASKKKQELIEQRNKEEEVQKAGEGKGEGATELGTKADENDKQPSNEASPSKGESSGNSWLEKEKKKKEKKEKKAKKLAKASNGSSS
ncbi:ribonuclease III [Trematosphaeria pertusa]|uniref:Ribonuclease III n=1 Tax=Trematosphaeria pertusa TaxID=390896 RepID=A0A6A6IUZ4_9PLEO|nr:ribonuclease III [Trematosphaeria pertusa]KAF2253947.1 ribonuclease III [Trematosphaeria pertusa]